MTTTLIGVLVMAGVVMVVAGLEVRKNCYYRKTARNAAGATVIGVSLIAVGIYLAVQQQIG